MPELGGELAGSPMARFPFLFDANIEVRQAAAEALRPAINTSAVHWSEDARLLLGALAAWAMEKDELFLEHYATLGPVLDELPVAARDLWVSAALIRFSRKDWMSLTGDSLPDSIADLSDPLVYLIVELAAVRATVSEIKEPSQALARKIESIQKNLNALVARLDSQIPETVSV